jgi:microsomal dipeptidase-like Zn-dependent dipeptidase
VPVQSQTLQLLIDMIFDLHPHTSLKPFLSNIHPDKKISCWSNIKVCNLLDDIAEHRLDSQTCLTQMAGGNVVLAVPALYAMEREIASALTVRIIDLTSSKVSNRLLRKIRERKSGYGYIDLLKEDLGHFRKAADEQPGQLVFLKKDDSMETADLAGRINILFAIEGGHAFLNTETVQEFNYNDDAQIATVINRFETFVNDNSDLTFVYLTLTHIAQGPFCNQTFAYPNFTECISTANFLPRSLVGINKAGWTVIQKCHEKNILVDVKHMSYVSRCQYYKYLKDNELSVPILASHMGCAGIAFMDVKMLWTKDSKYKNCFNIKVPRSQGLMDTICSPLTLSLFDEEIKYIVDSNGLIGLSLDDRILGYIKKATTDDTEYIYKEEYNYLMEGNYETEMDFLETIDGSNYISTLEYTATDDLADIHTRYFCNNILRIVYAGGANAWNCISIGSDFDGLVVAIDSCKTANDFANFREKVLYWLPIMIQTVENYGSVFNVDETNLNNDIEQKVNQIMFENGQKFFIKYLSS